MNLKRVVWALHIYPRPHHPGNAILHLTKEEVTEVKEVLLHEIAAQIKLDLVVPINLVVAICEIPTHISKVVIILTSSKPSLIILLI